MLRRGRALPWRRPLFGERVPVQVDWETTKGLERVRETSGRRDQEAE